MADPEEIGGRIALLIWTRLKPADRADVFGELDGQEQQELQAGLRRAMERDR